MEDRIIENNKSAKSSGRQEYADRLFYALVACYTNDLKHGLKNFTSINHVKNLGRFKAFLEEFGHSIAEAHQLAIVERRQLRKERTKARNEKIKTDRIAAREERRRMKADREQKEGWATEPIPEGMFIQFYPKPHESVPRMLVEIKESESKRKLSRLQKKFEKYDLAILDECGYKSLDKVAAEHLFNHISLRAGMKSTIITTNLGFDRWDEIFTDKIIAAAIVDRLTFKSFIIDMNGPSYRLKATEQWINERKNTDKRHK